jgi:hypothetical protein
MMFAARYLAKFLHLFAVALNVTELKLLEENLLKCKIKYLS